MSYTIELETKLETAELINALLIRRENLGHRRYSEQTIESIDNVLEQFVGTTAGDVYLTGWAGHRDDLAVCDECGAVRFNEDLEAHKNWCDEERREAEA